MVNCEEKVNNTERIFEELKFIAEHVTSLETLFTQILGELHGERGPQIFISTRVREEDTLFRESPPQFN